MSENLNDAREFCQGAFGPLGVDIEPYAKIVAELMDHATVRERQRCATLAEQRALKLREKAKEQKNGPPKQSYFAQAIEARVIADAIRRC
jgi:hypothetical protein